MQSRDLKVPNDNSLPRRRFVFGSFTLFRGFLVVLGPLQRNLCIVVVFVDLERGLEIGDGLIPLA